MELIVSSFFFPLFVLARTPSLSLFSQSLRSDGRIYSGEGKKSILRLSNILQFYFIYLHYVCMSTRLPDPMHIRLFAMHCLQRLNRTYMHAHKASERWERERKCKQHHTERQKAEWIFACVLRSMRNIFDFSIISEEFMEWLCINAHTNDICSRAHSVMQYTKFFNFIKLFYQTARS